MLTQEIVILLGDGLLLVVSVICRILKIYFPFLVRAQSLLYYQTNSVEQKLFIIVDLLVYIIHRLNLYSLRGVHNQRYKPV